MDVFIRRHSVQQIDVLPVRAGWRVRTAGVDQGPYLTVDLALMVAGVHLASLRSRGMQVALVVHESAAAAQPSTSACSG
jgi:hypothetical protein